MLENVPLFFYRISGWTINLATLILAFFALKSKNMWVGKYKYMGFFFVLMAFVELYASITVFLTTNNLYIDYWYIPAIFSLRIFYLSKQTDSKIIERITIFILAAFIILQIYIGFHEEINGLNTIGQNIASLLLISYCVRNLTILFKEKSGTKKLRFSPDFWFTITILVLNLKAFFQDILEETTYVSGNTEVLYIFRSSGSFIKVFLLYGYYKGIKLLG